MSERLLVGCPVLLRDWALPHWFRHLDAAASNANLDLEFVFVGGEWDVASWGAINAGASGRTVHKVVIDEPRTIKARTRWTADRYERMVEIRNALLGKVRQIEPDLFFSLDSDILLNPDALGPLIEFHRNNKHAASAAGVMLAPRAPNYFRKSVPSRGGYDRRMNGQIAVRVDVIMAAKMMSPVAFWTDYEWAANGEDIGWSNAVTAKGGTLGWDNRYPSVHMYRGEMDVEAGVWPDVYA